MAVETKFRLFSAKLLTPAKSMTAISTVVGSCPITRFISSLLSVSFKRSISGSNPAKVKPPKLSMSERLRSFKLTSESVESGNFEKSACVELGRIKGMAIVEKLNLARTHFFQS